ncbi:MAG: hypothetical protein F6K31_13385 [Symploca sp. SIO2G7]|nr:hypothetical protein [Symploca sp. SIO2G7]
MSVDCCLLPDELLPTFKAVLMKKFFHHQVMKVGSSLLPVACCLLPVACCLLPTYKSGGKKGCTVSHLPKTYHLPPTT